MPEVKRGQLEAAPEHLGKRHPSRAQVRDFLVVLLHEVCEISSDRIKDTATIDHDFEMESIQMVQLQVAMEQEYDISLDFLEILRLNSFGPIVDYVHSLASPP
jgi:acyl carrier protein